MRVFVFFLMMLVSLGGLLGGYRLITNTGADGGQSVYHIHMHLIGGKHLPFRFE